MTEHDDPAGDCFEVAANIVVGPFDALPGAVLVHGRPTLQRPPFGKYAHAWVELGDVCIDRSNGLSVVMRREKFYARGQIDPGECFYYTQAKAREMILTFKHYGPWEGPEGCPPLPDFEDDIDDEEP